MIARGLSVLLAFLMAGCGPSRSAKPSDGGPSAPGLGAAPNVADVAPAPAAVLRRVRGVPIEGGTAVGCTGELCDGDYRIDARGLLTVELGAAEGTTITLLDQDVMVGPKPAVTTVRLLDAILRLSASDAFAPDARIAVVARFATPGQRASRSVLKLEVKPVLTTFLPLVANGKLPWHADAHAKFKRDAAVLIGEKSMEFIGPADARVWDLDLIALTEEKVHFASSCQYRVVSGPHAGENTEKHRMETDLLLTLYDLHSGRKVAKTFAAKLSPCPTQMTTAEYLGDYYDSDGPRAWLERELKVRPDGDAGVENLPPPMIAPPPATRIPELDDLRRRFEAAGYKVTDTSVTPEGGAKHVELNGTKGGVDAKIAAYDFADVVTAEVPGVYRMGRTFGATVIAIGGDEYTARDVMDALVSGPPTDAKALSHAVSALGFHEANPPTVLDDPSGLNDISFYWKDAGDRVSLFGTVIDIGGALSGKELGKRATLSGARMLYVETNGEGQALLEALMR